MRRLIDQHLIYWFNQKDRKPLILRGARQVGKTTSVRMLAQSLNLTLLEANMEDPQSFLDILASNNPKEIFEIMALEQGIDQLEPSQTLVFFDEVQECPKILSFLRYCFERASEYAVICAGSLLEFTLSDIQASFPVGRVEYQYMGPMTFEEFLLAKSKKGLLTKLHEFDLEKRMSSAVHNLLEREFREYLICGGMPEVVKSHAEGSGLLSTEKIKISILESYRSDFSKYNKYTRMKPNIEIIRSLFDKISSQIGNKIKYNKLVENVRADQVKKGIHFLENASVLSISYHSSADLPPIRALKNEKWLKLFFLDIGLVQSEFGVSISDIKTNQNLNSLAKGALTEQFIAQHLLRLKPSFYKPELFHWSRNRKGSEAEVDFLIELEGQIIPIEVKSGTSKTMHSLKMLQIEKQFPFAVRFYNGPAKIETSTITTDKSVIKYQLISLPHYLVEQLPKLLIPILATL